MKVAIVYDRVNKWGGAERVLLALHEIFPEAPLYTSVYDAKRAPWAKVFPAVVTSFLQKFPFAKSNHELFPILMPMAFESFDFSGFDLVISVTSEAAKGVRTKPGTMHICYCLTPTRYLWSHYDDYFGSRAFRFITRPLINYLRNWDKAAAARPDKLVAISSEVRERIRKFYGRESEIIFPPVDVTPTRVKGVEKGKYYLIVSRLVRYKNVDLAIKAFNRLKKPLVVVGVGREMKRLKKMAGKNIKFAGEVSENELVKYYEGAKALVMPQEEDFGIVAVEAQRAGVPVIAYKKGGAIDTVIPGETGVFFDEQEPESLIEGVLKFEKMRFVVDNLFTNVKRFSKDEFKKKFIELTV
jgi:glycosyltransferase involved in cell wall biosynthesis